MHFLIPTISLLAGSAIALPRPQSLDSVTGELSAVTGELNTVANIAVSAAGVKTAPQANSVVSAVPDLTKRQITNTTSIPSSPVTSATSPLTHLLDSLISTVLADIRSVISFLDININVQTQIINAVQKGVTTVLTQTTTVLTSVQTEGGLLTGVEQAITSATGISSLKTGVQKKDLSAPVKVEDVASKITGIVDGVVEEVLRTVNQILEAAGVQIDTQDKVVSVVKTVFGDVQGRIATVASLMAIKLV